MTNPSLKTSPADAFRRFLADCMGLHYPKEKDRELLVKLERIAKALGIDDLQECVLFLSDYKHTKRHLPLLAKELTVGETYFFRSSQVFRTLEKEILPEIIRSNTAQEKKLRCWSAAACTGEEAYSLAIVIDRLLGNQKGWEVSILGTDINHDFLQKAKSGLYKEWSFRDTEESFKKNYFTATGPREYLLNERYRAMVTFEHLNLVENTYPSPLTAIHEMDLILCNNVLIYFTPLVINRVVNRLASTLKEGGWLIVSSVEAPFVEHRHLISQKVGSTYAFRKRISQPAPPPPKPVVRDEPPIAPVKKPLRVPLPPLPPRPADDLMQLIRSLANQGEVEKARELCEKGLEKDDLNPTLYYYYGMALQEMGSFEPAAKAYRSALFLDSGFIMCHFALGGLLLLRGEEKEAKRHLRNTMELLKAVPGDQTVPESDSMAADKLVFLTDNLMRGSDGPKKG